MNTIEEAARLHADNKKHDVTRARKDSRERAVEDFETGAYYVDGLLRPVIQRMEQKVMFLQRQQEQLARALRACDQVWKCFAEFEDFSVCHDYIDVAMSMTEMSLNAINVHSQLTEIE